MNNKRVTEKFIYMLGMYYINFGNTWNVNDFINKTNENKKETLKECLRTLESVGIVEILNDNFDFKIIDLPSKFDIEKQRSLT